MSHRHPQPWIDISIALHSGLLCWPEDPPPVVRADQQMSAGDPLNLTSLIMSAHTGTHVDAPRHFISDGATVDQMPLELMVGPAKVIAIADPRCVTVAELAEHELGAHDRVLLKTQNSSRRWYAEPFAQDFVALTPSAAAWLAARAVSLVGIDYLSISSYADDPAPVHRTLLEAGVWILEGLDLSQVQPGDYELICLPLKIAHSDGGPARALVRRR